MEELFLEIAAVIVTAGVVSLVIHRLRQPLVIAYIFTGLLVGPSILGFTASSDVFDAFGEIGIAFLLFLVGLNLNWHKARDVGQISILAGIGQVLFTTLAGFGIAIWLGFDSITSLLLGFALALSSTIVIVKLLSDKEDLDRFYGRMSVGILIVQDVVAMIALLVVAALGTDGAALEDVLAFAIVEGVVVLVVLIGLSRWVLPHLVRYAARSQELLFLIALSWCFAVATALHLIGFGIEIGALLAGISLATTGFQREIGSKIKPLRDFFLIIFFIVLGTQLSLMSVSSYTAEAFIFSAFVLFGNPLIVILIFRAFGYHPRTGFLTGITLAQVSEFSFLLIAASISAGLVDGTILPLVTLVAIITIAFSTYLIEYNEAIYRAIGGWFAWMGEGLRGRMKKQMSTPDILLFGYHGMGEAMIQTLTNLKEDFVVVDFDPVAVEEMEKANIPHTYADVGSEEFLRDMHAHRAKFIISTIPDVSLNRDILGFISARRGKASVIVTVKKMEDIAEMYELGATYVIVPNALGGERFSELLKKKRLRKASWSAVGKQQKKHAVPTR